MRSKLELLGTVLLIIFLAMAIIAFISPSFGWRADSVLSGSMEPALSKGDLIITGPVSPEDLEIGDIITFVAPTGQLVCHRIIDIEQGEEITFITKGDANEDPDPFLVTEENLVGEVSTSLPIVGYLVQFIKSPIGIGVLAVSIIILFVFDDRFPYWNNRQKKETEGETDHDG